MVQETYVFGQSAKVLLRCTAICLFRQVAFAWSKGRVRPLCADPNYAHIPRESQHRPLFGPAMLRIVTAFSGNARLGVMALRACYTSGRDINVSNRRAASTINSGTAEKFKKVLVTSLSMQ